MANINNLTLQAFAEYQLPFLPAVERFSDISSNPHYTLLVIEGENPETLHPLPPSDTSTNPIILHIL